MLGRVIKVDEYLNVTTDEVVYEEGKVAILHGRYVTIVREEDLKYGGFGEWGTIDGITEPQSYKGDYIHQIHRWVNIVATNNPELIEMGYPEIDGDNIPSEGDIFIEDKKLPDTGFFIWKEKGGVYPNIVDGKVKVFNPRDVRFPVK